MPTPQAELLYPKAVSILEDLEQLKDEIMECGTTISGELILGASTIPGEYLLPIMASAFKKKYPLISFEIQISDSLKTISKIANHELLLGIVGAKTSSRKVKYLDFLSDNLVLAASVKNDIPDRITSEDLADLPFILREESSGTRKYFESFLSLKNIKTSQLKICAILGSNTAIKEAIKANLGVSILSEHAIKDELEAGILKKIEVDGISLERKFHIITPQRRTLPNHYQVFLNHLKIFLAQSKRAKSLLKAD